MTFSLRPYQEKIISEARTALMRVDSVMIQSAVGSGKTALSAFMLDGAAKRGLRSAFICHRQELIDQTAETFQAVGIDFGIVAAGYRPNPFQTVQICSIDTLKSRLEKIEPFKFLVFDEAHHCSAAGWTKVKQHYSSVKTVGLSATPERLDRKGLDHLFDEMICGPTTEWLIDQGYLSRYRIYSGAAPDLGDVADRMGDFARDQLEKAMNKVQITGDAVIEYQRRAAGKRAVAFCSGIQHSKDVVSAFQLSGITAEHIDGSTERGERKRIIDRFRSGETKILSNVDLVGEGFNLPAIEASILLRPTQSLALYIQQIGRCMRPADGKDFAVILDHAGNLSRHGLPCDDREWSLKARKKNKKAEIKLKQCPSCDGWHPTAQKCPYCGFSYVGGGAAREGPELIEGDLSEIDVVALKARKRAEVKACKTLVDLKALGKSRGYKPGWATHEWERRQSWRLKRVHSMQDEDSRI